MYGKHRTFCHRALNLIMAVATLLALCLPLGQPPSLAAGELMLAAQSARSLPAVTFSAPHLPRAALVDAA